MKSKFMTVAMLAVLGLAGCGNKTTKPTEQATDANPATEQATTTAATVDHSGLKTEIVIGSPAKHHEFVKAQVEGFLKKEGYTNVTVKMSDLGEGDAKNTADWTAAGAPDIYGYASDQLLDLMKKGALAEVPEAYSEEMLKNMKVADVNAGKVGDSYYGYPYAGDNGYYLYYNKDLIAEKDTASFESLVKACAARGVKFGYSIEETFFSIGTMFSFGARYNVTLNKEGAIASVKADFNTEKGLKAAKAMQAILANPNVAPTNSDGRNVPPSKASHLGALVDGSWNYDAFLNGAKNDDGTVKFAGLGDKLGCVKLPTITIDGDTQNISSFLGYKEYGVNPQKSSGNAERLAALHAVANFLVSDSVQSGRWDALKVAPTSKAVSAMEKVTSDAHIKAINDQAKYSVAQTIVPGTIWDAQTALINSIKDKGNNATDAELQGFLNTYNDAVESAK